jgi:recombination protein RecT
MNATDMKKSLQQRPAEAENPMVVVRESLERMRPELARVLPPQISADRLVRITLTAIQMQPSLLEADRKSLLSSTMRAAQDGLLPDGREAALVLFNRKGGGKSVQYMPMVGGLLKKARQSGELRSICAHVIYENDAFDYWVDTDGEHLNHKPVLFGERGSPRGVYALAQTIDGGVYIEPMSLSDVEKVRSVSRAKGEDSPWQTWWAEMAKKSALRRLMKRLPSSTDIEASLEHDNLTYEVRPEKEIETTFDNPPPVSYADVMEAMKAAMTQEELDEAAANIDLVAPEQRESLTAEYEAFSARLAAEPT